MVQIENDTVMSPKEPVEQEIEKQIQIFKNGAKWFYWIAGLSLVNTTLSLIGGDIRFPVGLGITQLIDVFATSAPEDVSQTVVLIVKIIAVVLNVAIAGIITLFGWLSLKRFGWAFVAGIILFSLDGVLSLLLADWIGL